MLRKRPLIWFVGAFSLGCFFSDKFGEITIIVISLIFCEILSFLLNSVEKCKTEEFCRKCPKIIFLTLGITILLGGVFSSYFTNLRVAEIEKYNDKNLEVIGTVYDEGVDKGNYFQYILKDIFIDGKKISSKVLLTTKDELQYGNKVKMKAKLEIPKGKRNSVGFDYNKYLRQKDIYITAESWDTSILEKNKINFIEYISYKIRNKVREFTSYSLNKEESGIMNALIIGDESSLSSDIEEQYKKSGMIHLLVVSGGHTLFLLALLKWICNMFNVSRNMSKYIFIFVIFFYIFITGVTPSILRAGIACIIVIISELIGRQNDPFNTLFLVLLLILLNNPNAIFSLSLQLSFFGAIGIMMGNKIYDKLMFLPKIIAEPLSLTIAAQLFVSPILISNFYVLYGGSVFSNILTMALSGFIMMAGMVLFVIYVFIPPIVILPMKIVAFFVNIMNCVANLFSKIDFLIFYIPKPTNLSIVLYYILLIYFLAKTQDTSMFCEEKSLVKIENNIKFFIWKNSKKIIIYLSVFLIIFTNFINIKVTSDLEISVIDVGHGDCIFIKTPNNKNILIDAGDCYKQGDKVYDTGESTIIPYLLGKGIKKIDLLILTHFDSDHIGGFSSIANAIKIDTLAISINAPKKEKYKEIIQIAKENIIRVKMLQTRDTFMFNEVKVDVLLPSKEEYVENENNDSIVLMMEYRGKKILFMGDLEKEGEEKLLKSQKDLKVDVLKVGHHGSNTSSSSEFVLATKPKVALISVGNRFSSIPGKDVLERFNYIETKVYRTDKMGEINIKINNDKIKIETIY